MYLTAYFSEYVVQFDYNIVDVAKVHVQGISIFNQRVCICRLMIFPIQIDIASHHTHLKQGTHTMIKNYITKIILKIFRLKKILVTSRLHIHIM